ncbi:tetratricopeptide repeat protein [bacterium]|nr:tetratricopeptide repeat protein [bacterium]
MLSSDANRDAEMFSAVMQAHYLSFIGNVDEGLSMFKDTLQHFSESSELHFQFAKFLIDLAYRVQDQSLAVDYLESARSNLESSISLDVGNIQVHKLLAEVYIELREYQEAVGCLKHILEIERDDQEIQLALARLYVHADQAQDAIELLKPSISAGDLENYEILKVYALACGESNRLMEAISSYQLYLKQFPMEYEALYNLGLCYFRSSQLISADNILQLMAKNDMLTPEVAELLTDVLRALGRHGEAFDLLKVIAFDPRNKIVQTSR